MLKMTGVRLEKILDIYMYLYIEKGLRGGISYIAKRCSEANNKYMKNCDLIKPFKWLKNVDNFDANSIGEKNPMGYILEVDLKSFP